MSSQLTIFLLVFGGLQGILFSIFLIRKKLHHSGYIYLLFYFAVMLLQIALKLMSKGWLMENWNVVYELSYQLPFLYGPLIYLFVRQLIQKTPFQRTDLFHFVPFAMLVFFFIIGHLHDESPAVLFPFLLVKFRLLLQITSLYLYHWLALQCWMDSRQTNHRFSSTLESQFKWLKKFIYSSFFVCVAIAFLNFFIVVLYPELNYVRPGFIVLTLFIYWISYEALHHPEVFSVIKGYADESVSANDNVPKLIIHRLSKKYQKSNLTEEEAGRIEQAILVLMLEKKPFMDPEMNIEGLAAMVDSNRHHLSQVLNEKMKKSFYDFINYYRVTEAKLLLADPSRINYKIASIAYDAGFNSLSTFNDVFRKCTGFTPSQFRKQPVQVCQQKRV